ncbi:MAG: tetratricopeptide repeat protein [Gemmatimonadetes bacterium]|nr:tetratricopeptide repeat protein [Gemmatimonadota bacterium]
MPHRLVIALAAACLLLPPLGAQAPATPRPKGATELRADSLLRAGNPVEAERLYRQLAQADSTLLRAWYGVGNAAVAQQRIAEAAEAFERAAVGGRLVAAVYNAGAMHSRLGHVDAAMA